MKVDKETLLVIIACAALVFAWPSITKFFGWGSDQPTAAAGEVQQQSPESTAPAADVVSAPLSPPAKTVEKPSPMPLIVLSNEDFSLSIQPVDGTIEKLCYSRFKRGNGQQLEIETADAFGLLCDDERLSAAASCNRRDEKNCEITRSIPCGQGSVQLTQHFTLADHGYLVRCRYEFYNPGKETVLLDDLALSAGDFAPWHEMSGDKIRGVSYRMDYKNASGDVDDVSGDAKDEKFFLQPTPSVRWAGVSNKYFCSLLDNADQDHFELWQRRRYPENAEGKEYPLIAVGSRLKSIRLAPGERKKFAYRLYAGPKDAEQLKAFEKDAVDVMHTAWGPLNPIAKALLAILKFFNRFVHSFGLSIIMLTLLVRLVFYPLTARGNESMKKMQRVQPLFKELREKYKDNPQLLNQKMTELYRKEGVNPFAGCLPILLQIPIFFALYQMLDSAIELRHVSFLWCKNLAAADTVASVPLPFVDWSLPINPLVLAMTVLMVIQQRMTPAAMDPAQKKMMALMPIIMLLFLYDLPSGLTLYWTVSNLFSILQLWLQKKRGQNPAPAAEKK